jgi:elongation factor G
VVHTPSGPRTVALVGPYGTGKSTLFEALLAAAGTRLARGAERGGNEVRVAHTNFMDEPWALIDCPGSVEFAHDAAHALAVADLAVVVADPAPTRAATLAPLLHRLQHFNVPFLIFINRIDTLDNPVRDTVAALQAYTACPLVQREIPIREGEAVSGFVDVISERAYSYKDEQHHAAPPAALAERELEARAGLVEVLADHDDALLEKLIEDATISSAEIYRRLREDQATSQVAGVLFGAADRGWGIFRLWKALRHDTSSASETASRRGVAPEDAPLAQIFRTQHTGQGGKLSWARLWRGTLKDGAQLNSNRLGGIQKAPAGEAVKIAEAGAGEIVALGRLEGVLTGAVLGERAPATLITLPPPEPVYALAIATTDRKDDVRLSGSLQKLLEEQPSLSVEHTEAGETILAGQGEIHLRAALDRLANGYGMRVTSRPPGIAYRETIRRPVHQQGRLKRQTGGHGQFADVRLDIAPRPRGAGFQFIDKVVGGAVPRQYIPAVGEAAEEAMHKGAFGYPVVDIVVTLVDGRYHDVDSSDMAFRNATRLAITEALPNADPVLLEPIDHVTISVPNNFTANAQRLLTGRRGQILGYAEQPGMAGWDDVEALVPQADLFGLIIELRSMTMGLGTYRRRFDHLAEVHGKAAAAVQRAAAG